MNEEIAADDPEIEEETADAPETSETEPEQEPEEGQTEEGQQEEGEEGEGDDAEDWAEVEIEGRSYVIPKDLEGHFMMEADYRQKTAEVSETRKSVEAKEQQLQEWAKAVHEDLEEHAQLHSIDAELKQYEGIDWNSLREEDFETYQAHRDRLNDLRYARDQVARAVQAKGAERASKAAEEAAKLEETTRSTLARDIPNYGPQVERDLKTAAAKYGYSVEQVDQALKYDANAVKVLYDAMRFRELVSKQKAAPKREAPKPAPKVGARKSSPSNNDPKDSQSIDDWVRARERQIAKKRGAA